MKQVFRKYSYKICNLSTVSNVIWVAVITKNR